MRDEFFRRGCLVDLFQRAVFGGQAVECGFVDLTFAGPSLSAEYKDLDGTKVLREEWTVEVNGAIQLQSRQKLITDANFHA